MVATPTLQKQLETRGFRSIVRWTRAEPEFQVKFVALRRDGEAGCAALWGGRENPAEAALQTASGLRILTGKFLYEGAR